MDPYSGRRNLHCCSILPGGHQAGPPVPRSDGHERCLRAGLSIFDDNGVWRELRRRPPLNLVAASMLISLAATQITA